MEVENIDLVVRRVRDALPDATICVVDDSSPDGTADKATALAGEVGNMHVLRRPRKMGLGSAYREGFAAGIARGYDVLVEIDADLSHDPADLPRLLRGVERGADLAIGSRYVDGGSVPHWPRGRLLLSKAGNRYASWALGLQVRDATAGYRAYRATMLKQVDYASAGSSGYGFQVELTYRVHCAGGSITEVPICFTDRVRGRSKMSLRIVAEAMTSVTRWAIRDRLHPNQHSQAPATEPVDALAG
jgi:glycosyltransferase involved in cell wall biosynthesis